MEKNIIRKQILELLKNKSEEDRDKESDDICQRAIALIPKDAKYVSVFNSYQWEIDTKAIHEYLEKNNITACYPKIIDEENGGMQMVDNTESLIKPEDIDVIFVPCVAFYKNNRLGYGKGFYDRYLKTYKNKKYVLAFDDQEIEFNVDAHDVKVKRI